MRPWPPRPARPPTNGLSPGLGRAAVQGNPTLVTQPRHTAKKLHPADAWTRERVARAISYTVVFVRSPLDGGNIARPALTLAQAFAPPMCSPRSMAATGAAPASTPSTRTA